MPGCRHRDAGGLGSAIDPGRHAAPRDLDLAVVVSLGSDLLRVVGRLAEHLAFDQIDVLDLDRAGTVARMQALARGELLYEATPGTFAERQMVAVVQHADTRWLRDRQLEALAR